MAAEDWIYPHDPDDEAGEQECKFCGEAPLWWEYREGRWILVDDGDRAHAPHCTGRQANPGEFPALGET